MKLLHRLSPHLPPIVTVLAVLMVLGTARPAAGRPEDKPTAPRLEFRILANAEDDKEGLDAARKFLAGAKDDARRKAELQKRAEQSQPPPPMKLAGDKAPTYSWVEVGPAERLALKLEGDVDPEVKQYYTEFREKVARAREKGETFLLASGQLLLYSRPCQNTRLTKKERERKKVDYFLLTRDPAPGTALTSEHLTGVKASEAPGGGRAVSLTLNQKGGELLYEVTSRNKPTRGGLFRRHLAIVFDGQIFAAPAIHAPIRGREAWIYGLFTAKEVDAMVEALRKGIAKDKK
jgi:hypothetical protein